MQLKQARASEDRLDTRCLGNKELEYALGFRMPHICLHVYSVNIKEASGAFQGQPLGMEAGEQGSSTDCLTAGKVPAPTAHLPRLGLLFCL